jgi:hypothetical protein
MSRVPRRIAVSCLLALSISGCGGGGGGSAQSSLPNFTRYVAVLVSTELPPSGFTQASVLTGTNGRFQVGNLILHQILPPPSSQAATARLAPGGRLEPVAPNQGGGHAFLLSDAGSPIDIQPADLDTSYVNSLDKLGSFHAVGFGQGHDTPTQETHALLWNGAVGSAVDLNPHGSKESQARGIYGDTQVGYAFGGNFGSHAAMWHGSAASAIDLNPKLVISSAINAIWGDVEVGVGDGHALLWRGTPQSVVDLNPATFKASQANDVFGNVQVGTGNLTPNVPGGLRALMWSGSAASVVELVPTGLFSEAFAVVGNTQVGYVAHSTPLGPARNATLWHGTAASKVDLHQFASGLKLPNGNPVFNSAATAIDSTGRIVGYVSDLNEDSYAVIWTPVP